MRVLTFSQPWAQLVARGVKQFDVRTTSSDYRGPVLIHAARVPPRQTVLAECVRNRKLERVLGTQGLLSYAALMELPRSAIVGIVDLESVVGYRKFRERWPDVELLSPVMPEKVDFVWTFGEALEIEPVPGVPGRVKLWTLSETFRQAVGEAEERAIAHGPPAGNETARRERTELYQRRFIEERIAEHEAEAPKKFIVPKFEKIFRRTLARYYAIHPIREVGSEPRSVKLVGKLKALFPDREYVSPEEFEKGLRWYIEEYAEAGTTAATSPDREEAYGPAVQAQWIDFERSEGSDY